MTESTEKKSTGKKHASAEIGVKQAASQLVLTLDSGPDVEFYPHALDLDEGISCNPRAELRAYSTACLSKKQIDELMGIDATLEIHQQLEVPSGSSKEAGTYRKVTRAFSGIVTEVRHLGRKSDPLAAGTAVYAYDFVIEGELCRLKRSVHTRTFLSKGGDSANVGLECVLRKILEGTNFELVFPKKKEDSSVQFNSFGNFNHGSPTILSYPEFREKQIFSEVPEFSDILLQSQGQEPGEEHFLLFP